MPLIAHLKAGFDGLKPPAWHRNEERRARGMHPIDNPATQLEGWERELVWMEILVLTGAPGASFRHLARAWGRDKGFHMVLAQFICERQGDVQRKKRIAEKHGEDSHATADKSLGPAKKRRRVKRNPNLSADVSADIWDDSAYGDVITNEALAADIFDFSPQEFESATALHRWKHLEDNSDTASVSSQRSMNSQAAATAILGNTRVGKIMPKPSAIKMRSTSKADHPEQNPETSALILGPGSSVLPTTAAQQEYFAPRPLAPTVAICVQQPQDHPFHQASEMAIIHQQDEQANQTHFSPRAQMPVQQTHHGLYHHDGETSVVLQHHVASIQTHVAPTEQVKDQQAHHPQYHQDGDVTIVLKQHGRVNPSHVATTEQMQVQQTHHPQYHHDGPANQEYQQHEQVQQGHCNVDAHQQRGQFHQTIAHPPQYSTITQQHHEQQQLQFQGEVQQTHLTQFQHQEDYQGLAQRHAELQHLGQNHLHQLSQTMDLAVSSIRTANQEHTYDSTPLPIHYMPQSQSTHTSHEQIHGQYESAPDLGYNHQQPQHYLQPQDMHQEDHNASLLHDEGHSLRRKREHPEQNPETSAIPPELAHPPGKQHYQ